MNAHALHHAELLLQVFALRLFHTGIVNGAYPRTDGQFEAQVNLVAHQRVGRNADTGEQTVLPVAVDGRGNLGAWHRNALAYGQTGEAGQHIVFITLNALDGNTAYFTLARRAGIGYLRLYYDILSSCIYRQKGKKVKG